MLLTAAMVLSLLPAVTLTAFATTYDGEYNINSGSVTIYDAGNYRIYGDGTATGNTIFLCNAYTSNKGGIINITLENVNISQGGDYPFTVNYGTTVNLTLVGTNTIDGSGGSCAGIALVESSTLIITKASTGSLDVTGGSYCAGIGGDYEAGWSQGTLVIEGGTVTAKGGMYGAGIGAGLYDSHTLLGSIGTPTGAVVITGGTVNATGGDYAAGIGTGGVLLGPVDIIGSSLVYISGGNVTANGGYKGGAGIGGGQWSTSAGMIVITGGNVIANGSFCGAGIGAGGSSYSCAGYINISGGTVTATGGYYSSTYPSYCGAGIGGGRYGDAGVVTISGGVVTAIGGYGSLPGIGGGYGSQGFGDGGVVTITGGTVTSLRRDGTPDIGSGSTTVTSKSEGSLYISGASVNASFGGTVYASSESNVPLYLTTVTSLPTGSAVTYAVDGGNSASCTTDENGYLYLWLPESAETTVNITADDVTYEVTGEISSDGTTVLAAADPLELTSASMSYGVVGTAYSQTLTAEGGTSPYTWSATGLPNGLTLDEDTGVISGIPTETGAFSVLVTVTDDDGTTVTESLTLTVYLESSAVPRITVANGIAFTVTLYDTYGKYAGISSTDYGTITGTVSGSDTILTGTLTDVPTSWTEVALTGGKVMLRSVTAPSTSVDAPTFH